MRPDEIEAFCSKIFEDTRTGIGSWFRSATPTLFGILRGAGISNALWQTNTTERETTGTVLFSTGAGLLKLQVKVGDVVGGQRENSYSITLTPWVEIASIEDEWSQAWSQLMGQFSELSRTKSRILLRSNGEIPMPTSPRDSWGCVSLLDNKPESHRDIGRFLGGVLKDMSLR